MIKVSFGGLRERLQTLDRLEREQLPFAAALALTSTAQVVADDLRAEMQVVFDRPTPATLNSLFIQPATKQRMEARVWIKDGGSAGPAGRSVGGTGAWGKGRAAIKWLTPEVFGGPRDDKGVERLLRRRGVLAQGQYVVPGEKLPLDQYGNVSRGTLNKILSGASLFTQEGYSANATGSKRSRAKGNAKRYFVMHDSNRKPFAIAERTGLGRSGLRVVLAFTKRPSYSKALDWYAIAERSAEQSLPIEFEKAMAQALATMRRR
jgi:hypothetical protein